MNIKIYNETAEEIIISCLDDLEKLPALSIKILINNTNYIRVIYLYTLLRFSNVLEEIGYAHKSRERYFDLCMEQIIPISKNWDVFYLGDKKQTLRAFKKLPKIAHGICMRSLEITSARIAGMLSTTPYLEPTLFPNLEHKKITKHMYGTMVSVLM